jgi:hypothetical protein
MHDIATQVRKIAVIVVTMHTPAAGGWPYYVGDVAAKKHKIANLQP